MHSLLDHVSPRIAIIPATQTAAAHSGNPINGTGYDRCLFLYAIGSGAGASTQTWAISKSATSNGTYTAVTGASFVSFSSTATITNRLAAMDIPIDPAKPWVYPVDTVGTATLDGCCIALLYKGSGTLPPAVVAPVGGSLIAAKTVIV